MHNNININVSGPVQPTSTYKTVVLKGNHSFASQVTEPNTKYVIKHNFDLSGGAIVYDGWEIEGMGGNPSIIDGEEYWLTDYESGIAEPTTYNLVDDECFFVIDNHISEVKELTLQYEESAWIATKRRGYHARILSHYDSNAAITIPEGCLLEFDGGAISNGTLVGQNTYLIYNQSPNDILTATLEGTWKHDSGVKTAEIYDNIQQKNQETINSELIAAVGTGGSVDSKIAAAVHVEKNRAEEVENALDGRVDTLEEAVGTGGSVDSRISSAVSVEATRAQAAEQLLQEQYNALTQSDIAIGALPASGTENLIYRVPGTNSYSDYMWNGTQFVKMAEYDNAIDDGPTPESNNLVKSGGVYNIGSQFSNGINVASTYKMMNIADANPSITNHFKSDMSYYKLSDGIIQITSNYPVTIVCYSLSKTYLGFITSSTTGKREINIRETYSLCDFIRVSMRKYDYSAISEAEYAEMYYEILNGASPERYTKETTDEVFATKSELNNESNIRNLSDILLSESKSNLASPTKEIDFQDGKILRNDGSVSDLTGFKTYSISNTGTEPLFIKTVFSALAFNVFANCILYMDAVAVANIPLVGSHVLALPAGCSIKICTTSNTDLFTSNTPIEEHSTKNPFYGKKLLFLGTSIPAGSSSQVTVNDYTGPNKYPEMIGELLGCTVYNECVGSSIIRAKNPRTGTYKGMPFDACLKSLSQTISEKQSIMDHWTSGLDADGNIQEGGTYGWRDLLTEQGSGVPSDYADFASAETILGWSYENKIIAKYFNQYSGKFVASPDIVIIEHAHNDIAPNYYISSGQYYYDTTEEEATTFTDNYTDRSLYPSSMSYILRQIFAWQPRQRIIIWGHYSNDLPSVAGRKYSEWIITAQENCAKYWNLPIVRTWNYTGWGTAQIKTNGYWDNGNWVNGNTQVNMMTYRVWLADQLHPHSDKSGRANMRLAEIGEGILKTML